MANETKTNAARHTPGPWRVGSGCVVGSDDRMICGSALSRTGDEQNANAHLIAAAPDMLRACESLVHGVEDAVFRFLDSHDLALRADMEIVLRARVERARAAIAKAVSR